MLWLTSRTTRGRHLFPGRCSLEPVWDICVALLWHFNQHCPGSLEDKELFWAPFEPWTQSSLRAGGDVYHMENMHGEMSLTLLCSHHTFKSQSSLHSAFITRNSLTFLFMVFLFRIILHSAAHLLPESENRFSSWFGSQSTWQHYEALSWLGTNSVGKTLSNSGLESGLRGFSAGSQSKRPLDVACLLHTFWVLPWMDCVQ